MAEGSRHGSANLVLLNSDFNDVLVLFEGRRVVNNIAHVAPGLKTIYSFIDRDLSPVSC